MKITKALTAALIASVIVPGLAWAAPQVTPLPVKCNTEEISGIFCIIENVITTLLGVGGVIAFLFLVYGGLQYIISGGDEKAITVAKSTITYAALGLILILASILIINTVLSTFLK
ncbi:MAG TPA: hypothetical protein VI794_02305 [Patescibacteria group bacterium]|nr:hypothetical protein [Patescibacteria group bacterium]